MTDSGRKSVESETPRPWLKPSAALARFAPRLRDEHDAAAREQVIRYGFSIGDVGLLVSLQAGCEVIAIPTIARLPTTPAWLLGVANLRGNLVPIFDLPALLETPAVENRFGLIFDRGEHAVGILIAEHPVALDKLEPLLQAPSPPPAAREFVSGAFRQGRSVWMEFDHRQFFESIAQRMSLYSVGEST
jgi:chemotaxis signal transduction protein